MDQEKEKNSLIGFLKDKITSLKGEESVGILLEEKATIVDSDIQEV